MNVNELTEIKAKKALKAAVKIITLDLSCEFCEHEAVCKGDDECEGYALKSLLEKPDDLHKHLIFSNGV
jgi:hypothetical protein